MRPLSSVAATVYLKGRFEPPLLALQASDVKCLDLEVFFDPELRSFAPQP
jgi:hypothetical protein